MLEFTEQERNTITDILKRNLENLTPEEVELYARWKTAVALSEAEFEAKIQAMKEESANKIEKFNEIAVTAKQNLKDLKKSALARLERIDEQTKQN